MVHMNYMFAVSEMKFLVGYVSYVFLESVWYDSCIASFGGCYGPVQLIDYNFLSTRGMYITTVIVLELGCYGTYDS